MLRLLARPLVVALVGSLLWLPGGSGAQASPGCEGGDRSFTVGTHNTLHGRAHFTPFAAIIGWQEVTDPRDRAKLRRQLGRKYQSYIPRTDDAAAIPISWKRRSFTYLTSRSVKTHGGKYRVSPSRWINIVHLRQRSTGRRVIVVNTHFVSEAFRPGASHRAWRLRAWYAHRADLYRVVSQIRARRPHAALLLVGDFNRNRYLAFRSWRMYPMKLGPGSHPKDQMYAAVPAHGGCVERLTKEGSDHWRRRARIRIH